MLVLSRHANEVIHIGDEITITIVRIQNTSVRIGISAPRDMPVYRSELGERVQRPVVREKPAPQPYTAELPNPSPALKATIEGKESGE